MAVDAVFTWVNFLDPAWRASYEHFAVLESKPVRRPDPENTAAIRHADNGELRYSLRSLERHAPFIRRLHLVIDGAPPEWLDTASPGVRVLSSRDIFPGSFRLPVFNSSLIEAHLWRIPDLSEEYIYFNDDMLLAGDCGPEDFFDPDGRAIVRMKSGLVHAPLDPIDLTYNRMVRNTARAIRRRLSLRYRPRFETRKPWIPMVARRIVQNRLPLNMMAHIVQPFRRSLWPLFHETFRSELVTLATSRFRHGRGFCVNLAYHYLAHQEGQARFAFESNDLIIRRGPALSQPDAHKTDLRNALESGVKFLCFNDGAGGAAGEWSSFIDDCLRDTLDTPSRWEKARRTAC